MVPGGPVEADSLAMVGAAAIRAVEDVRTDVAVLGACSVSAQHGLTSTTYDDAAVKRACLASASRRILVAAPEKLTRTSTFRCGDVADLTLVAEDPQRTFAERGADALRRTEVVATLVGGEFTHGGR